MTVYFQIAELADIYASLNHQNGGNYNSTNVRTAIGARSDLGQADTVSWFKGAPFSATNMWLHFVAHSYVPYWGSPSIAYLASQSMVKVMAGGTKRFRLIQLLNTDPNTIQLDKWNGSSWDTLGSYTIGYGQYNFTNGLHTFDMHMTIGASTNIQVYMDNNVIIAVSGVDTTFGGTVSAFDDIYFSNCAGNGAYTYYSEIICADWNTIGSKVVVRIPDAAGAHTDWYNAAYTVVDEITGGTDYATSAIADQMVDWSMSNFPTASANEIIPLVKVNATVNRDLTGPQNMNFYIARSGIDYHQTDLTLPLIQAPRSQIFLTDPATNDVWTVANVNASTFGIRSRT